MDCWVLDVDWGTIANVVTAACTIVLTYIAWKGVEAWKRQLVAQRQQQLAESLLVSSFKVDEALDLLRYPYPRNGEKERMIKEEGEEQMAFERRKSGLWPEVTYREHASVFAELHALGISAGVVITPEVRLLTDRLVAISKEVIRSVRNVHHFRTTSGENPSAERIAEFQKHEGIAWSANELKEEIATLMVKLRGICESKIREIGGA